MMGVAMGFRGIGAAELEELVTRGARLDREFLVTTLPRLAALAPETSVPEETLSASLAFQPGAQGFPEVLLRVKGAVPLVCQRCLGPLRWEVDLEELLTVVGSDTDAGALEDPFQTVLTTSEGLMPGQMVEDEVLASLPLAPRHTGAVQCRPAVPTLDAEKLAGAVDTHRPLASLRDLLSRGGSRSDD